MNKKWRVCLLGAGMISDTHLEAWRSLPQAEIVALCDPNSERRRDKANRWGIPANSLYAGVQDALRDSRVDVVDIATPLRTHRELVELAARAGKHILCQKPLAPSPQDARAMLAVCEANNVRLMVAEAFRWRAHYMKVKEIVSSGRLGAIHFAKLSAKWYFSPTWRVVSVMRQPFFRETERLLIQEMGPHWFDLYLYLFGEPQSMKCFYRRVSPFAKGEDLAIVVFEHDSMIGMLEASWASREHLDGRFNRPDGVNTMDYVLIDGVDATLRLDCNGVLNLIRGRGDVERVPYELGEYVDAHKRLHRHFIECLESDRPFATSGQTNVRILEMIEEAYASGRHEQSGGTAL